MPGIAARPALVTMKQGAAELQASQDEAWDDGLELPIVDPAHILTTESRNGGVKFTIDQMVTLGEMGDINRRWIKLLQSLRDREGTLVDITADMMAYEDQAALTRVRTGPLDVRTQHVFCSLHGTASWPTVLAVECWLRDAILAAEKVIVQKAALTLWCLVVARAVGEEGTREVLQRAEVWYGFDVGAASCSRGGNDMVAAVALRQATGYKEFLWTKVMLAVDNASSECFWDWRRVENNCLVHGSKKCPPGGHTVQRYSMSIGGESCCNNPAFDERGGVCVNCGWAANDDFEDWEDVLDWGHDENEKPMPEALVVRRV